MNKFEIILPTDKLLRLECCRIADGNPTNAKECYDFIQLGDDGKPSSEKLELIS